MNASLELQGSRKRDKIRSAWISFAGRIVAQIIGAVATVMLGVVVLSRHAPAPVAAATSTPTVLIATPIRTHGETVIVMMPAGKDGQIDEAMARQLAESYEKTMTVRAQSHPGGPLQTPTDPRAPLSAGLSADSRVSPESPRE
jgi:hypothetical protein